MNYELCYEVNSTLYIIIYCPIKLKFLKKNLLIVCTPCVSFLFSNTFFELFIIIVFKFILWQIWIWVCSPDWNWRSFKIDNVLFMHSFTSDTSSFTSSITISACVPACIICCYNVFGGLEWKWWFRSLHFPWWKIVFFSLFLILVLILVTADVSIASQALLTCNHKNTADMFVNFGKV